MRDRVLERFLDDEIAERDRRLAGLTQELEVAEAVLAAAQPAAEVSPQDVRALVAAFAEWTCFPRLDRRRVLEALSPRFYVRRVGKRRRFSAGLQRGARCRTSAWREGTK